MKTAILSLSCLLAACAVGLDAPAPPATQYPLAREDPEAQLPAEYLGLPEEIVEARAPAPDLDPARASRGVRYAPGTGEETLLDPEPAPAAEGQTMFLPGFEGPPLVRPDVPDVGSSQQGIVFGGDDRVLVADTLGFPARALVKLYVTWPNGMKGSCSGTLIGKKNVLTAGHCVHNNAKGGWAAQVRAVPGLDGTYMPFGSAYKVYYDSVTGWTEDENNDYDFAMVTLDRNLGDATGWLGLATLSDDDMDGLYSAVQGYPGDLSNGARQYAAAGPVENEDSTMIYYNIDSYPGDSGAILHGVSSWSNYIFGVHTGDSWFWLTHYNRATRINNSRFTQIQGWMSTRAGLGTVGGDFTGWTSLGGKTYTAPSMVTWGGGRIDAFVRGLDGAVWHDVRTTGWTGWQSIGGSMTGSVAAVSRGPNQLDLFARGSDGALWTKALNNTTWWPAGASWYRLGGNIAGNPVAVSWGWSRLDVFARDAGGAVVWWRWTGAGWTGPVSLGGTTTDNPAAASWGTNRIDLVARDVSGAIVHKWYDGTTWSAWSSLGGYLGGSPSIVSPSDGVLEIFARDGDSGVWHQRWDKGWSGWIYLGGNITDDVAAVSRMPGQIDLFVRDAGGAVYTKALNGAGVWWPAGTNWARLGGDMLGTPSVVSTASNRLDLLARGSENGLKLRSWNGSSW